MIPNPQMMAMLMRKQGSQANGLLDPQPMQDGMMGQQLDIAQIQAIIQALQGGGGLLAQGGKYVIPPVWNPTPTSGTRG